MRMEAGSLGHNMSGLTGKEAAALHASLYGSSSNNDDDPNSPPAPRRRRRANRRASTGAWSSSEVSDDEQQALNASTQLTSSSDEAAGVDITESANFRRAARRGSLSKMESQEKLRQSLSQVGDYKESGDKIQQLKEQFSHSKGNLKPTPRRMTRRGSLSSYHSSFGGSQASSHFASTSGSRDEVPSDVSIDLSFGQSRKSGDQSMNMSGDTIPMANVFQQKDDCDQSLRQNAKTDQIVESLVWFSFHTPRTVLEDLVSHELDIWKKETKKSSLLQKKLEKGFNRHDKKKKKDYKMSYMMRNDDSDDESDEADSGHSSLSSLSDDDRTVSDSIFNGSFSESMLRLQRQANGSRMIKLPKSVDRESALLFVDMSGFTKLSTILDVESLSKVINSYFDMIVSEVIQFGGDILKFAGDAFFAEWRVMDDDDEEDAKGSNPLKMLNASLASINEIGLDDDVPSLSLCVLAAAKCGASIVKKFSDYQVLSDSKTTSNESEAMLNVHCGVGVGNLVGLHVGDYKEGQIEEAVESRREFLILGSAIDQVSKAADVATDGEIMASPEAMLQLAFCCDITYEQRESREPVCIASKDKVFVNFGSDGANSSPEADSAALQPYDSLRMHCKSLNHAALARLHLQMALYVHPVIRGDELALSRAIQAGKISQPTETVETRHRAEAELRSVLTIFIKAIISPRITGMKVIDEELFQKLLDIMHVTSRELDRYSGHLRQFIVDDKGVVLIATFGLRGSTFPNMISNNGLPAIFSIHRALKNELNVESRIGATFGKVYCGVVGGVRRHEFAVMGAPVNLAARLMSSKVNNGILVDEAVQEQADARFAFNKLPPVQAKGYDKPVPILEPSEVDTRKGRNKSVPFTGRKREKEVVMDIASDILQNPSSQSTMIFVMGESGMGKSALAISLLDDIKKIQAEKESVINVASARSTSTETEQRIPLSSYRKVFLSIVHDFCEFDGTLTSGHHSDEGRSTNSNSLASVSAVSVSSRSMHSFATPMTPMTPITPTRGRMSAGRKPRSFSGHHNQATTPMTGQRPTLPRTPKVPSNQDVSGEAGGKKGVRDLTEHFTSPGKIRRNHLPNSANLSQSVHGDSKKPSSRKDLISHSSHHRTPEPRHRESLGQSLHRLSIASGGSMNRMHKKSPSLHTRRRGGGFRDDSSYTSYDTETVQTKTNMAHVPYFEKLCWVCEQLDYPYEYADIVGSQFLGLEGASPVTHVEGHIPTMDELSEFLALAFIFIADYADLTVVVLDDFQWVDAFSWKIFQVLCKRGDRILLICATRSHDKQALRRLSMAAGQNDLHNHMVEISLGPLDFNEIRDLIAKVLRQKEDAVSDALCTDIFQRTGGLPVYVVQVLENIRKKKSLELDANGILQWTEEGLKEKRAMAFNKSGAVMEETFLSRFDSLDVRVRKVLQTCAVLGLSFALSDVIQVHPELEEMDIEDALEIAVDEMILLEHVSDDDETISLISLKSGGTNSRAGSSNASGSGTGHTTSTVARSAERGKNIVDRSFQFSHAMWRQNVLTTMLKERKIELHRLIAQAMERDQVLILEQSDITRLLTLFEHWKSCGDFCKTAPLALAVGSRLEEWDLSAQSLELYEDCLEMSYDTVQKMEGEGDNAEWVHVAAKPAVLDYILRLHIRIGLCHQNLGDDYESICMFEDAYNIIKTTSKLPAISKALMMPIISSLCVLKLEEIADDERTRLEQAKLAEKFVKEAVENGNPVHIGRALAMEATHHARLEDFERAFESFERLKEMYDVEVNSFDMLAEYGRDFALECYCESVQWYYLQEMHEEAEQQADLVIHSFLPLLHQVDVDIVMYALLPLIQVLKLIGRAVDAESLLKNYAIDPYHRDGSLADFWAPLFNPLAYLLDLIAMEESDEYDEQLLEEVGVWVIDEENHDYGEELEREAFTILGEICWRLMDFKDEDDPERELLAEKARDLLEPIASYPHPDTFLKHTAQALIEAL